MTVATLANKAIFTGDGSATTYPFTFGTLPSGDLVVTLFDTNGIDTLQVEGVDYNVLGEGSVDGGAVVFSIAPPDGHTVLIQRIVPVTQPDDLKNEGSYYPRTIERMFDRRTFVDQQLQERVDSAMTLPPQVAGVSTQLPAPEANTIFGWNAAADAIQNFPLSSIATNIVYGNKLYQVFVGDGTTDSFALLQDPASIGNLRVQIDGIGQEPIADFTFTSTTLTLIPAPAVGARVVVWYDVAFPVGAVSVDAIDYTPPSTGVLGSIRGFLDSLWTAGTATGAALIRFLQSGSGAVARTAQGKMQEQIAVFDFIDQSKHAGIRAGTNTDDHTANIQAAINAAAGRRLLWNSGTFNVSALTGVSGIDIKGEGRNSVIVKRISSAATGTMLLFNANTGFSISGITFDGNKAAASNGGNNVAIFACSDYTVEDCRFTGAKTVAGGYGAGLAIADGTNDTTNRPGVVQNNLCDANDAHGILVDEDWYVRISGNFCTANGSCGIDVTNTDTPFEGERHNYITISDNTCVSNLNCGIRVFGFVVGGTVANPDYGPYSPSGVGAVVSGNRCIANSQYGIAFQGAMGNVVDNYCRSNGSSTSNGGMLVNGWGNTADSNVVQDNYYYGIDGGGSYNSTFSNNQFMLNGSTSNQQAVALNLGATVDCLCIGNTFSSNGNSAGGTSIYAQGYDGDGSSTGTYSWTGSGLKITGNRIALANVNQAGVHINYGFGVCSLSDNFVTGGDPDRAYILETEFVRVGNNNLDQGGLAAVRTLPSAATLIIPDAGEMFYVSGSTGISAARTKSADTWNQKVRYVYMTNKGTSPYSSAPSVGFSGGGGSGAAGTALLDNDGYVAAVQITNSGTGYTSAPTVAFTGGGGAGAAGSAIVGCANNEGRNVQFLFQGALTWSDGGGVDLAGALNTTANKNTLSLRGAYGVWYESGRTTL